MTIRNINGRNVYVIDPSSGRGQTTSGRSWATLYSDLRWQVWEEKQKDILRQAQLQGQAYKAQVDIYEQSQRDIRRSITQLQQLRATALAGGSTARQIASQAAKQAQLDQSQQRINAQTVQRGRTEVTRIEPARDIIGDIIPGQYFETRTVTERPTPQIGRTVIGDSAAAADAADTRQAGIDFLDAEIAELEQELDAMERPSIPGLDVGVQTQRAFERDVGVIGQGGGPFGLAPRRRRTQPRVDQQLAQERINQFTEDVARDDDERRQLFEARAALLGRRAEAMALEGDMSGDLVMDINKQIGDIEEVLATPSLRNRVMDSPEFTPRRAGELLLRDRPQEQRGGGEPFVPRDRTQRPVGTIEAGELEFDIPEEPITEPEPVSASPFSGAMVTPPPETAAPIPPDMLRVDVPRPSPQDLAGRGMPSVAGTGDIPTFEEDPTVPQRTGPMDLEIFQGLAAPPGQQFRPQIPTPGNVPAPTPVGQPQATIDQARQAIQNNPSIVQIARQYFRGMSVENQKVAFPQQFFGGREEMVREYLTEQMRAETPVGGSIPVQPTREERKAAPRTTTQRKNKYMADVISEGTRLASQPKRLARIAKTNADEGDRPRHYVLVDQLYSVNSIRGNAFKKTYDEISRFFKNKPELREQAHAYLVAIDTLQNQSPMK